MNSRSSISRRDWFKVLGGGSAIVLLSDQVGCSYFASESGDAYAPWNFPGGETRPEMVAGRAAILAANPHNSQPWAMRISVDQIELHADLTRGLGSIDSLLREMYIGLGCALENLTIAARASGRAVDVHLLPDMSNPSLVARVSLTPSTPTSEPLFSSIARRHTNRGRYADAPPSAALLPALQSHVTESNVALHFLTSATERSRFVEGTIAATSAFIADPQMSHDSNEWWRQTADDILQRRDGLTLDASGNGASTRFFGKSGGTPSEETANAYWLDSTRNDQSTASAFCILSSPISNLREDQLRIGRVYQRMHLWAIGQGLAMQPLNQLPEMQDRQETLGQSPTFAAMLDDLMGSTDRRAQMLFRIGYPWDQALESPRRPLEWVML
jgi:hypothetical protein